jgi:phosphate transport system substrate-binding protein
MIDQPMQIVRLAIYMALLAACAAEPPAATPVPTPIIGRIAFAGSTTVQPLVEQLRSGYTQQYPDVKLDIAAGGSVVGINAVREGSADIGMASRELRPEERTDGIEAFQIATDVLGIIVHPSNPISELSLAQLQGIYSGEIVNWNELGGLDLPIIPVIREISSGTRGAFDDLVLGGLAPTPTANIQVTAGEVESKVASDTGAIGYVGFANLKLNVKVLAIDSVLPSPQTVQAKTYRLSRPLYLLLGPLSRSIARSFIEYVLSPEGQQIVAADGWVPITPTK